MENKSKDKQTDRGISSSDAKKHKTKKEEANSSEKRKTRNSRKKARRQNRKRKKRILSSDNGRYSKVQRFNKPIQNKAMQKLKPGSSSNKNSN